MYIVQYINNIKFSHQKQESKKNIDSYPMNISKRMEAHKEVIRSSWF